MSASADRKSPENYFPKDDIRPALLTPLLTPSPRVAAFSAKLNPVAIAAAMKFADSVAQ